jgi:Protein of unknown function (DUF3349)
MGKFLRAGYPEGVPQHDYLPLFALLARKLTSEEQLSCIRTSARSARPPIDGGRVDAGSPWGDRCASCTSTS